MDNSGSRPFGMWMTTALVVGSMIGAGIFALPSVLAPIAGTGTVAWFVAVAGALVLGWVLTQLAGAYPRDTGVVAISARALGPLPGLLLGWSYWVGVWSANAIIAIVACRYLWVFVPQLADTPMHNALAATALIWALTAFNLAGARVSGSFNVVATVLKLVPLVAVVVILAGLALAGGEAFSATPHAPFVAAELTPALAVVFTAMVGFESASLIAERVRDPARTVVRATMAGIVLTGALYLIVCSGIIHAMPQDVVANAAAPVALFVETFWGRGAGLAVGAFGAIAAIGCLNGWVLVQGEVPLGMARSGLLPAWFRRTSARDVPVRMLVVSSLLATILVISSAMRAEGNLLDFMLRVTAAATLWLYIGACVAAPVLKVAPRFAAVGLAFSLWAMWGAGLEPFGWSVVLMLTALPLYGLRARGAGVV